MAPLLEKPAMVTAWATVALVVAVMATAPLPTALEAAARLAAVSLRL